MEEIRERLCDLLRERAIRRGEFVLASGKKSDFYVDAKQVTLHPEGLYLVSKLVLHMMEGLSVHAVGGLTMGADPIAGGVVALSQLEGHPVSGFIVRKSQKGHGLGKVVEGILQTGDRVVVLDDVVTTGGSTLEAIRAVEAAGAKVVKAICLVDREEGGREALESYPFAPIFRRSELVLG